MGKEWNVVMPKYLGFAVACIAVGVGFVFLTLKMRFNETSAATTYYVSSTGSDNNSGSQASPFATIQKAADVVNPGDTVIIMDGVYTGNNLCNGDHAVVCLNRGGTSSFLVTFKSQNKWGAKVQGQEGINNIVWEFTSSANYIRIEGFDISGSSAIAADGDASGITMFNGGHHSQIIGNNIHNIGNICTDTSKGQTGIFMEQPNILIEGNLIHDIGRFALGENGCSTSNNYYENHDHGVYIDGSAYSSTIPGANYTTVKNNIFYNNNRGWAIQAYPGSLTGVSILNNTFAFANLYRGPHIIIGANTTNMQISNNISYQPLGSFIDFYAGTHTNFTVSNNLTTAPSIGNKAPAGVSFSNNEVSTDPNFVSPSTYNFHLQSVSPAINSGFSWYEVSVDFDGNSRPQGLAYDKGAYEYIESAPTPTPTPTPTSTPAVSGSVSSLFAGGFLLQGETGCGYVNVYTTSSTVYLPTGYVLKVGDTVQVYGSGSCATLFDATQVVGPNLSPTPTPTPTPTPISTPVPDIIAPVISAFDIQPRTTTGNITVTFSATDAGGSYIKNADLKMAPYTSTCNETTRTSCSWSTPMTLVASPNLTSWSSSMTYTPVAGKYLFGLQVLDNAGNKGYEPFLITIDATVPTPTSTPAVSGSVSSLFAGGFLLQGETGCGYVNVYTTSSTVYLPTGYVLKVGDTVQVYGSGSCATLFDATQVVGPNLSPTPTPTPVSDITAPVVTSFDVQPRQSTNSKRTVSWAFMDSGGSYLSRAEIKRAPYNNSSCNETTKTGCKWSRLKTIYAPANSNSWVSSTSVSQYIGAYWYGIHAVDKAGNRAYESAPIKAVR